MKKSLNFLAVAAAATVLLSLPSAAKAQVGFGGTFRGPHGTFSIGVGDGFVPQIGGYVPSPFADQVYLTDDGYGFDYDGEWIPCTRYGSRWVIVERPIVVQRPVFYGRDAYRYRYVRPYRSHGRIYSFHGRRDYGRRDYGRRDYRNDHRNDRRNDYRSDYRSDRRNDNRNDRRGDNRNGRGNRDSRRGWNGNR